MDQKFTKRKWPVRLFVFALVALSQWLTPAMAQVDVVATGGTPMASYTNLSSAFTAINNGVHTGNIGVGISASFTDVTNAILNSSGAGSASYTSVTVAPTVDGVTISFATAGGRGVIELNGADNVTIDGDNPNTAGTNRNLTIVNTAAAATTYTSVIRVATGTAAPYLDNNNIIIRNLILNGSATGQNNSGVTSTTGAGNTTFGVVAGPGGGAAVAALASVSTAMNASATVDAFTINNCAINQCARGIGFLGNSATSSTQVTITNNLIGEQATTLSGLPPYTTPATTVYTKGIIVQGITSLNISGNSIRNILSYIGTAMCGIELSSAIGAGAGTITVNANTVIGVVNNTAGNAVNGILFSSATVPYTLNNNIVSNIQLLGAASSHGMNLSSSGSSGLIENNKINYVYARNSGGYGARGILLSAGNNVTIRNNMIWDMNMVNNNSTTGTTFGARGINITSGTGHKVYYNSISLYGAVLGSSTGSDITCCLAITGTGLTDIDVRNNLFSNTMTNATGTLQHACLQLPSAGTSTMNLTLNNNAYYTGTAANSNVLITSSTLNTYTAANFNPAATTPATNARAFTSTLNAAGTNDNASFASTAAAPFTSATDLHVNIGAVTAVDVDAKGVSIAGVTLDIDVDTRNATTPDIGADEFTIPVCAGAVGGTASPATSNICNGQSVALSVTGATLGTGVTFQWEVSSTGGGVGFANVTGGTGATTTAYNTGALTPGIYYYRLNVTCSTGPVTGYSNEVTVTVNALPTIGITPASPSKCSSDPAVNLTASGAVGYTWSPAGGLSATTGSSVNANPTGTTTYTITGTDGNGCVNTGTVTLTVDQVPTAPVVTPGSPAICSGGSIVLNASSTYSTPLSAVQGAGASTTTLTSTGAANWPNPFAHYYGGNKHQILIRASELTAMGMAPGAVINSIGFPIASVSTTEALQSFLVRMGHTPLTAITAFQTGLTDVRNAAVYNVSATPGVNTLVFDTPFTWNGTDNIIIETSFSNNDSPSAGNVTMTYGTTAYNSTIVYKADNTVAATMNGWTTTVSHTLTQRPNITFNWVVPVAVPGANISWSPGTGLSATTGGSVTANPATTTTYTLTATNGACTSAPGSVTLNVGDPLVCTPITAPGGLVCAGSSFSLTANLTGGGAPYSYAWSDGVGGVYPDAATITPSLPAGSYTFTVTITDNCGSNCSSNVTVNVSPNGGTITGPATGLTHQNMTYTASSYPVGSTFQWQSGTTAGGPYTNVTGATADNLGVSTGIPGTYYYVCVITAPGGCVTTSNEIVTVITLAGDNVCSAIPLTTGLNGPFSNQGATTETGEVVPPLGACTGQASWCSGTGSISNTVWFSFVAPASGKASLHFIPGNWDSEIAVWSAASCGDLLTGGGTFIAANDDSSGSSPYNAFIDVTCLTPGATYYVQVDGYSTTTNNNFSLFLKNHTNAVPTIAGMPSNMTVSNTVGSCGATVTWTAPTLNDSDNCIASMANLTSTHNSGDMFPIGTTTVTYTGTDGVNTVNASFNVTVNDTELPAITGMPGDITMAQNNTGCTAIVTWTAPGTSDNCAAPVLTSSHNSGDVFPLGTTVVTYTSTDASNNITTASFNVTVTSDLDATLNTSSNASCNGSNDGTIDASVTGSGTPYGYDWNAGAFTSEDLTNLTANVYTLVVTDVNSCTDTLVVTITEPAAITSSQTLTLCDGQSVTVGSNTYTATGVYTDVFTAAGGCDSTVTTNLTVNAPVNVGTSTSAQTITASSATGTYQWINCTTLAPIAGETNQAFTATSDGSYAVIVTESGCTDTSACVNITGTGIAVNAQLSFGLYPNPTQGAFTIVTALEGTYSLVNALGDVVMTGKLTAGQNQLNAGNTARGMYLVKIHDVNGRLLNTQRLTITK